MKKLLFLLTVLVCAKMAFAQTTSNRPTANSSVLPIKRVVLYSNGVAYFERRGNVTGDVEIDLAFKQSQVDDVLKSMVVLDLGNGRIGEVSYASSMPGSARTAEIPFDIDPQTDEGDGIAGVLGQLQGEKVAVVSDKGTFTGSILTVEKRSLQNEADKIRMPSFYLVLASETGEISNLNLADVRSIKLIDKASTRDINEFANATASTRRRDSKTISVTSRGTGTREMVVSYTIAAPIWKTTYRAVLDESGRPFFQGWAIIDNISEEDWKGVKLSMVSGSPISFIQNLQQPLYRYRPVVPIPDDLNMTPQIYDPEGIGGGSGYGIGDGTGAGQRVIAETPIAGRDALDLASLMPGVNATANFMASSGFAGSSVSDALKNEIGGIQTAAVGSEFGELFEYKIEQPVTVLRNRSALIPIIQTRMEGERVSIFRADQNAVQGRTLRAMSGLMLQNTSDMTFEGGPITILDRDAYAGEALMERLKAKEQRLISFALDLGTLITVNDRSTRSPVRMVKAVDGVLQLHYFRTSLKLYKLANQTDRKKVVYVEHPIRKDWTLSAEHAKPDVVTASFYRFRVELQPFETKELPVGENYGMMDRYTLSSFAPKDLELIVAGQHIDEPTRRRLQKLIDIRLKIMEIDKQLESIATETTSISEDQKRFRENIEALAKTPEARQLISRYIAKADEQESRLEKMTAEERQLRSAKSKLEVELAIEIKNFEVN